MEKLHFTQKDIEQATEFSRFLISKASWNLTTKEAIDLYRLLTWYNGSIEKMRANILEVSQVIPNIQKAKKVK